MPRCGAQDARCGLRRCVLICKRRLLRRDQERPSPHVFIIVPPPSKLLPCPDWAPLPHYKVDAVAIGDRQEARSASQPPQHVRARCAPFASLLSRRVFPAAMLGASDGLDGHSPFLAGESDALAVEDAINQARRGSFGALSALLASQRVEQTTQALSSLLPIVAECYNGCVSEKGQSTATAAAAAMPPSSAREALRVIQSKVRPRFPCVLARVTAACEINPARNDATGLL